MTHYKFGTSPEDLFEGSFVRKNLLVYDDGYGEVALGHDFSNHNLVGPLSDIFSNPEYVVTAKPLTKYLFVGDTMAGKTRAIRSICSALGGFVSETTDNGRTLSDYNVVFAYTPNHESNGFVYGIDLQSHAGHDITHSISDLNASLSKLYNLHRSDPMGYGLVIDSTRNLDSQLEQVSPLFLLSQTRASPKHSGFFPYISRLDILLTHSNSPHELDVSKIEKTFSKTDIGKVYCVNNSKNPSDISSLLELEPNNLSIVANRLFSLPQMQNSKFIYFGSEEIPSSLEQYVIKYDDVPFDFEEFSCFALENQQ